MCRIAGYYGPPTRLSALIQDPPHGLMHQSQVAREMNGSSVAGDGWGVGWFPPQGGPGLLKSFLPLWSCINAKTAPPAIVSGSILGHIRLASSGSEVCFLNTPLYILGDYLFTVNGELKPWPGPLSRDLRRELDGEDEGAVQGATDGELLGALWHTHLRRTHPDNPAAALRAALRQARDLAQAHGGSVKSNVIISHRKGLVAVRYADSETPNSLYYHSQGEGAAREILVASEPLDDRPGWQRVEESTLLRADARGVHLEDLGLDADLATASAGGGRQRVRRG